MQKSMGKEHWGLKIRDKRLYNPVRQKSLTHVAKQVAMSQSGRIKKTPPSNYKNGNVSVSSN